MEETVAHPFSITIFGDMMYWTDWNHKSIERANRFTGADHVILQNITRRPNGIRVIHPLRQPKGEPPTLKELVDLIRLGY